MAGTKAKKKTTEVEETEQKVTKPIEEVDEDSDESFSAPAREPGFSGNASTQTNQASTEASPSIKNFRHHPDMENFYRFIFENDLRLEALAILDEMAAETKLRKNVQKSKAAPH